MTINKNTRFLLLFLCTFFALGSVQTAKGSQLAFEFLDSTFNAKLNNSDDKELQSLLDQMKVLASEPHEKGVFERNTGRFHRKANDWSLCLVPMERAEGYFEESNDIKNVIDVQLTQMYCHRYLGRLDRAIEVADKMVQNCLKIPEDEIPLMSLRVRGYLYRDLGKMDSALMLQTQVARIAQAQGETMHLTMAKQEIATIYQIQGKQKLALETALEIEQAIFELPQAQIQIQYLNLMGMIQMGLKQFDESLSSYKSALKIAQDNHFKGPESQGFNNIGICLKAKGDTLAAIGYFEQALDQAMPLNNYHLISSIASHLAECHIKLKKWKQADKYADKAYYYSKKVASPRMTSYAIMRMAEVKIGIDDNAAALEILPEADSIARAIGNYTRVKKINEMMSLASENLNDMEGALKYQRIATIAQDSIDFLDAKMYADSLKLSQPIVNVSSNFPDSPNNRNWAIWMVASLLSLGIIAFLWFRSRPKADLAIPEQEEAKRVSASSDPKVVTQTIQSLKTHKDWTAFMLQFDSIYPGLMESMAQRHPDITPTDMRILALSRLGLSADEFGNLLGISTESAKKARYRTRKRLGIEAGLSLLQYMLQG
mgnify:CR=1 FL=1